MAANAEREDLLDIKQAAQFLQVSETSLRRWTNSGQLASLRVGRRRERRFRREDLVGFMEHQPVGAEHRPTSRGNSETRRTSVGGMSVLLGTHLCGLYDSEDGRAAQAANFLADGLRAGTVCYLVAESTTIEQVCARLEKGAATSIDADITAGRLVMSHYESNAPLQCQYFESVMLAATRAGASTLRVVGDVPSVILSKGRSLSEVTKYETDYQRLIARRFPVVTLCQYDARRLSGRDLLTVYKCHPDNFCFPAERLLT